MIYSRLREEGILMDSALGRMNLETENVGLQTPNRLKKYKKGYKKSSKSIKKNHEFQD
jgi:hypothetical protein